MRDQACRDNSHGGVTHTNCNTNFERLVRLRPSDLSSHPPRCRARASPRFSAGLMAAVAATRCWGTQRPQVFSLRQLERQ